MGPIHKQAPCQVESCRHGLSGTGGAEKSERLRSRTGSGEEPGREVGSARTTSSLRYVTGMCYETRGEFHRNQLELRSWVSLAAIRTRRSPRRSSIYGSSRYPSYYALTL